MTLINWDIFTASLIFSFLMTGSPGLNNVLTILFILHHGFKKALMFRLGVITWFPIMGVLGVLVLRPMIDSYSVLEDVFNIFGSLLLLYIGIKIFTTIPDIKGASKLKYIGFWGAGALQLINGKAWSMVIGITSIYTVDNVPLLTQALSIGLSLMVANVVCAVPWMVLTYALREKLANSKRLRVVNIVLGGLVIVIAVLPLLKYAV